ncbi:MAG: hypothetical protein IJ268_00750 [Proteobacteria bacterium]|nr:hypothetical protein [Pseudomonadota bacterium]MBQ9242717.1 hypothetical protein [Pseudomonadota bacterium]
MILDLSQLSDTTRILLEVIGYIGSAVCVASFAMTSVKKLRIVNCTGAIISTIYALLIWALPIALMNFIIAILDIYQLHKMHKFNEAFDLMPASVDGAYFKWFVERYRDELKTFDESMTFDNAQHVLYYVRDNEVAGVLAYDTKENGEADVRIDFVIPKYRDFQLGNYFFNARNPFFKEAGIHKFVTKTTNPIHEIYLKRINFKHHQSGEWVKEI